MFKARCSSSHLSSDPPNPCVGVGQTPLAMAWPVIPSTGLVTYDAASRVSSSPAVPMGNAASAKAPKCVNPRPHP